jgi:hypothetical protein
MVILLKTINMGVGKMKKFEINAERINFDDNIKFKVVIEASSFLEALLRFKNKHIYSYINSMVEL